MKQKHYMDIRHAGSEDLSGFSPGDHIVVQEKIDGANFSILYDPETGTVRSFGRKTELSPSNDLRGAWDWAQKLDADLIREVLGEHLILFMEWLVPHTVVYPQECYRNAYCYDVFDTRNGQYLLQTDVVEIVSRLHLRYVPVFYDGVFSDWESLSQFVGRTSLGGEYGEGIVVKNQTKIQLPDNHLPVYVKIVSNRFRETKPVPHKKETNPELQKLKDTAIELTNSIITKARVQKMIHNLVDEGLIRSSWDETDMRYLAGCLGKRVYDDCVKEEPEIVRQIDELYSFGKLVSSAAMRIAREILSDKLLASLRV